MIRTLRWPLTIAVAVVGLSFGGTAAADTITGQGTTAGHAYHGGNPASGDVYYASSVQVNRNAAGAVTKVRGAARITKVRNAVRVQVDRIAISKGTVLATANNVPANAGTGPTVLSATGFLPVAAGSCASYRVRANYSVRWTDGAVSHLSYLSPLTQVCGPKPPTPPGVPPRPTRDYNCTDFATHAQAQAVFDRYYPAYGDIFELDSDHDRIACESLP